jgi:hypothetical protein
MDSGQTPFPTLFFPLKHHSLKMGRDRGREGGREGGRERRERGERERKREGEREEGEGERSTRESITSL